MHAKGVSAGPLGWKKAALNQRPLLAHSGPHEAWRGLLCAVSSTDGRNTKPTVRFTFASFSKGEWLNSPEYLHLHRKNAPAGAFR